MKREKNSLLDQKIKALESLARHWNTLGLPYAVANGLQGYPETIGRDIDVGTTTEKLRTIVLETISYLQAGGFIVLPYKLGWPYWIVAFKRTPDGILSLQVDLFDHLQWGFAWIIDGLDRQVDQLSQGPFKIDPWLTIGKRLVLNGISGNFKTFDKKPWYLVTTKAELETLPGNFERLSGRDFPKLQLAISNKETAKLRSEFPRFRSAVFRQSLTSKHKIIPRLFNAWKKQYYFNWVPPRQGPILVLKNADPEMLQTLSDQIEEILPYAVKIYDEGDITKSGIDWTLKLIRKIRRSSALIEIQLFREQDWEKLMTTCRFSKQLLEPDIFLEMSRIDKDEALERLLAWLERDSPVRLRERYEEFSV